MKLKQGQIYTIDHCRKGRFQARLDEDHGTFVDVTVVYGAAKNISAGAGPYVVGDSFTFRKASATFDGQVME